MSFLVRFLGLAGTVLVLAACGGGGESSVTGATPGTGGSGGTPQTCSSANFCMGGASFFPTSATVARGAVVTWLNDSGVTHNVTFDNPAAAGAVAGGGSGNIPNHSSGTNSRTFSVAGSYPFHCTIHGSSMAGAVTVQ